MTDPSNAPAEGAPSSREPLVVAANSAQQVSVQIQTGDLTIVDESRVFIGANVVVQPPASEVTHAVGYAGRLWIVTMLMIFDRIMQL